MIKNKKAKWIVRAILLIGAVVSLFFVPWILVKAWILPLPDTVQEQVDEAIGYGLDGMIVYVDQAGNQPQFYTGGWKIEKTRFQPTQNHCSKSQALASCIQL